MANLFITTNLPSLVAQKNLSNVSSKVNQSLERLSTGFRLNKASDGAADIGIANNYERLQRGAMVAQTNIALGQSVLGIADGALQTINSNLQRVRELALTGANGTVNTAQISAIQEEVSSILAAISQVANSTNFDGKALLASSVSSSYIIQAGPKAADTVDIGGAFATATAAALGLTTGLGTVTSSLEFGSYLTTVDTAISNLNNLVNNVGQYQNYLNNSATIAASWVENYTSSLGTIRNTDFASETAKLTQNQVIQQAAASILSQANQLPSLALKLLQ